MQGMKNERACQPTKWFQRSLMVVLLMLSPLSVSTTAWAETDHVFGQFVDMHSEREAHQVNINTDDAERMSAKLKGIGLVKAQAIVAYREEFGPFSEPSDLLKVKGIGKKTLSIIAEQLIF